jgi:hypothetical protein
MMFTPRANVEVKLPFLAIAVIGGVGAVLARRAQMTRLVLFWFYAYIAYGVIWSAIGYFRGNAGVEDYFRLNVIWPILYLPLVLAIYRVEII